MTNGLGMEFEQWVAQRCGPVAYPEKDSHSWEDVLGLCEQLGTKCVKSWLSIPEPGAATQNVRAPHYCRLIESFDTVHLNVCPHYNRLGYTDDGGLPAATLELVESDWYQLARYLFDRYADRRMTILLGIFAELNCYMGTKVSKLEAYPVTEYINASHRGLARARREAGDIPLRVYDVAEVQCEVEYYDFVQRFFPEATADLYSLSYYCFHRDVGRQFGWIRDHTQPSETFGRQNLMLGEYGQVMENCCWNQAAQVRYLDAVLRAAWREDCQYAFLYEIADHDFVVDVSGHTGLVRWTPVATPRLSWDYYARINRGGAAVVPAEPRYEEPPWLDATRSDAGDLVVERIELTPAEPRAGDTVSVSATVRNAGAAAIAGSSVALFADELIFGYAGIPPLGPGESYEARAATENMEFVWRAAAGRHTIAAEVNARGKLTEADYRNNRYVRAVEVTG